MSPDIRMKTAIDKPMALLEKIKKHAFYWAPIPIRLIVGYGFLAHGMAKVMRGPEIFTGLLHAIGVPFPELMSWLTIIVEIIGGIAVLLGAFVPLASIPMAIILLVAMFTVHFQYGFSSIKLLAITPSGARFGPPGYETDLLYLAGIATLVMIGSGPLSLDTYRKKAKQGFEYAFGKR